MLYIAAMWYKIYQLASAVEHAVSPEKRKITRLEKAALKSMNAQDFRIADRVKDEEAIKAVENIYRLAKERGIPKIIIYKQDMPNAGYIHNGTMIISTGIMEMLNREELETVIAHEYGHQKQGKTFYYAQMATQIGMVLFAGYLTKKLTDRGQRFIDSWAEKRGRPLFANMQADRKRPKDRWVKSPIVIASILTFLGTGLMLLASLPLRAYSRRLEYDADKSAVELTGKPEIFINALEKFEYFKRTYKRGRFEPTNSLLNTEVPQQTLPERKESSKQGAWLEKNFSTHPEHEDRVSRIRSYRKGGYREQVTESREAAQANNLSAQLA